MNRIAQLDHKYVWHPFTQMRDWLQHTPLVIVSGKGAQLRDIRGRTFLDANSSIWTNLHGHSHPKINAAISGQLKKIAHSSALGLANEPASLLAEKLIQAANRLKQSRARRQPAFGRPAQPSLEKVFFSDNGSTALEVALKLAYEFSRRTKRLKTPKFLSLQGAYHGDTVGAVSLGHIDLFHKAYKGLLFKSDRAMSPYCYRCPFNRAKPERTDARDIASATGNVCPKQNNNFPPKRKRQSIRRLCVRAAHAGRRRNDPATRRLAKSRFRNRPRSRRTVNRRRSHDRFWPKRVPIGSPAKTKTSSLIFFAWQKD